MKHASPETLARLETLRALLRQRDGLRERRPGVFHLKSRSFLHFHEDPAGVFADVKLGDEFQRFRVTTQREQRALVRRIDEHLSRG